MKFTTDVVQDSRMRVRATELKWFKNPKTRIDVCSRRNVFEERIIIIRVVKYYAVLQHIDMSRLHLIFA